jgi:hypothetical protein
VPKKCHSLPLKNTSLTHFGELCFVFREPVPSNPIENAHVSHGSCTEIALILERGDGEPFYRDILSRDFRCA